MRARLVVFIIASLTGCTSNEPAPQKTDPAALVARVRGSARDLASFGRPAAHVTAKITLPERADGVATIGLDNSRSIAIRALDVANVAAAHEDGASVFAAVAPSTDLLLAPAGEGLEEVRVLNDAAARPTARWAIEPRDGIVELRVRDGGVEALDHNGHVAVRSDAMFAIDARGVRREPRLSLTRADSGYLLEATLDTAGLTAPIVLDPVWLPGPAMSTNRSGHAAVRAADGKVYIACGGTTRVEVFDPTTNSFSSAGDLTTSPSRCFLTIGPDGKLRVLGDGAVHTFDFTTKVWTPGATTSPRTGSSMIALPDGKILVTGGSAVAGIQAAVDLYDPVSNTWSSRAPMLSVRKDAMIALLPGGKVFVAGGDGGGTKLLSSTEIYDPATNTWSSGPTITYPTIGIADAAVVQLPDGKVLLVGGRYSDFNALSSTQVYDPVTNTIAPGPQLWTARSAPLTARTPDGSLFVIGGDELSVSSSKPSADVDVAEPGYAWGFGATLPKSTPLIFARSGATATALLDGRVLVVGGFAPTELFSSKANGSVCTWPNECASGFCISGVCCNTVCNGDCVQCNIAGKVGTCSPAPVNTECGAGPSCSGSTVSARGRCKDSGSGIECVAPASTACAGALVCADAISCLAKCTKDADCTTGACDIANGLCVVAADAGPAVAPVPEGSPKVLGSAQKCTSASECPSGFCVDGVCCDSACTSRCHSCVVPSSPGRCTEEPVGVDLRNECGGALSCSGTCGRRGVCTTNVVGSQCKPSVCTGPSTGKGAATCKAQGVACDESEAVPFDCGAYACDQAFGACRTSCTASDACAPGFTCNLTSKSCEQLPTEKDAGCSMTPVGARTRNTGALFVLAALAIATSRRSRK